MQRPQRVRSHYDILGVARDASLDDLKRAYRKLALVLHPDKRVDGVSEEEAVVRFQTLVEAFKVVSDVAKRKEYDAATAADAFAADATTPSGGVHDRESWNDVIARLEKAAKKHRKARARARANDARANDAPNPAEVGESLPFPMPPRPLGCLPQEIVLEVFGCAGVSRLVEVEARPRVGAVGAAFAKPGRWSRVLKFAMKDAEISRLAVAKNLTPMTSYTFRCRAGVTTADLGPEWSGEAGRLVPEIYGPWSDESVAARTEPLTEKEAARRARAEKKERERAERAEKAARKKEKKRKRKKEKESSKASKKKSKSKSKRRRRDDSDSDSSGDGDGGGSSSS